MSDLREKIARGIYETRNGNGCSPWTLRTKEHKKPYLADAVSVLATIEAAGYILVPKEHSKPIPDDCPNKNSCLWKHVPTDPEIGLHLCSHFGCPYTVSAESEQ